MKGLVGWPVADGLPTLVVTHQLRVERRTGGQGKFAGQRPTFYHWATPPTLGGTALPQIFLFLQKIGTQLEVFINSYTTRCPPISQKYPRSKKLNAY